MAGEYNFRHRSSGASGRSRRNFSTRESGSHDRPGVSGRERGQGRWINRQEYDQQRSFMGKGPKGYKRSDDRIYEEVCELLTRNPEIDATEIGVRVSEGIVTLEGKVPGRRAKRLAEEIIEDLPGVLEVKNEISAQRDRGPKGGPDEALRNDLGVEER
jgi:osmotically-inducible protein OsmY